MKKSRNSKVYKRQSIFIIISPGIIILLPIMQENLITFAPARKYRYYPLINRTPDKMCQDLIFTAHI